jgi:hypothetical protein
MQFNNHIRYFKINIQRKVDNAFMKPRKMSLPAIHKESNEKIIGKKRNHFAAGTTPSIEKIPLKRQTTEG